MGDRLDAVLGALAASRAALAEHLDRLTDDDLQRAEVADLLWEAGVADDWTRLVIDQSLDGRALAPRAPRARPAYLMTRELLRAWLDQTRGVLVARVRRLADADLERSVDLDGGRRQTYATLLLDAVERDAACAASLDPEAGRPPRQ